MEINANSAPELSYPTDTPFVLLEGGLVQNDPGIPVLDLDVLDCPVEDEDAVNEVLDLREKAVALGQFGIVEQVDEWLGERAPEYDVRVYSIDPNESYVKVEGGLVQNLPGIPVLDLDVFDSSDGHDEIAVLRAKAVDVDLAWVVAKCDEWLAAN